jgi:CheY-like chemotaxis protein
MPKTKILVVDDEQLIYRLCCAVLQKYGFQPIVAVNGLEGLDAYKKHQQEICLTLLDVSMPVMNGLEAVRVLFAKYSHPNDDSAPYSKSRSPRQRSWLQSASASSTRTTALHQRTPEGIINSIGNNQSQKHRTSGVVLPTCGDSSDE